MIRFYPTVYLFLSDFSECQIRNDNYYSSVYHYSAQLFTTETLNLFY